MKRYVIADLTVDMDVSGRTLRQAAAYEAAAQGDADITLQCDVPGVLALNPRFRTEETAEYMGTGLLFAWELLNFNGSFLHASAVLLDGKAYFFSATSGKGKSTHTEKWCRLFGARYLNDDKPAIRLTDGVWKAYGTPWSGKYDLSLPVGAPLGGIAFLERGDNAIRPMTAAEALPLFMQQSLWRLPDPEAMGRQLDLVDQLLRQVPIWKLTCRNDDEAALISHKAMTEK